jgi:hypothetical protein
VKRRHVVALGAATALLAVAGTSAWWRLDEDIKPARARSAQGSTVMAFAGPLARRGIRVIAMSQASSRSRWCRPHPRVAGLGRPEQRVRANAMLDHMLPVSTHAAGLRGDTAAGRRLVPLPLASLHLPPLIVSARDEGCGTDASAACTAA